MSYYEQASGCLSSQTLADSDPRHLHSVNINANAANAALSGAEHKLIVLLNNQKGVAEVEEGEEQKVTDIFSFSCFCTSSFLDAKKKENVCIRK